jgi:hypothetical protein
MNIRSCFSKKQRNNSQLEAESFAKLGCCLSVKNLGLLHTACPIANRRGPDCKLNGRSQERTALLTLDPLKIHPLDQIRCNRVEPPLPTESFHLI